MKSRESFFSAFCIRAFTLAFVAVGMAGCGGGGSSGGGSVSTTPTVAISSANAPAVAGAAISAAVGAASTPLGAATSTTSHSASTATTMQTIGKAVTAAAKSFDNQSQTPAIVTGTAYTYSCTSGTYTINGSGSSGTITYNNCSYVAGESMFGTISISNLSSSASSTSANIVLNLTMTMTSPAETVSIVGDIAYSETAATLHMSGNSLTYTSSIYGTRSMVNYSLDENRTTGAIIESFSCNSTAMGGVATVAITTPFTYATATSVYPNAGVATVTGASNTVLRITILGDETYTSYPAGQGQVKLEVSTDGGATYPTTLYVDWATLTI